VAGRGDERQCVDHRHLGLVAERDVLEADLSRSGAGSAAPPDRIGGLVAGVEQLEHPLGRSDAGLQHVRDRCELGERLGELPRVLDERLDVAERHRPRGDA